MLVSELLVQWVNGREAECKRARNDEHSNAVHRARMTGEALAATEIGALLLDDVRALEADRELLRAYGAVRASSKCPCAGCAGATLALNNRADALAAEAP